MFSKNETMNLEDGVQKNQCWNAVLQLLREKFLRKFGVNGQMYVLSFFVFVEAVIPQDILKTQETLKLGTLLEKT